MPISYKYSGVMVALGTPASLKSTGSGAGGPEIWSSSGLSKQQAWKKS